MKRVSLLLIVAAIALAVLLLAPGKLGATGLSWPLISPPGQFGESKYDIPSFDLDTTRVDYDGLIAKGLQQVKNKYGTAIARNVERVFRLETAHFSSQGWKKTLAAGMHPFSTTFPYAWTSVKALWEQNEAYRPIGVVELTEGGTGARRDYLVFQGIGGFMTLAEYLRFYNNNPGRWYSTNAGQQQQYISSLNNITTHYT